MENTLVKLPKLYKSEIKEQALKNDVITIMKSLKNLQ